MEETEKPRVVVLGGDATRRRRVAAWLRAAGQEVHQAEDGAAGLELTREVRPDLAVCEAVMPVLDGIGYCRRVKADPALRSIQVLVLTDRAGHRHRVAALDAGADDCLARPVAREELLARVRVGLRARRLLRDLVADEHRVALLELAATLGHEINNPLTALFGHLELAFRHVEGGDETRLHHHLARLGESAARLGHVVRRLVFLSEPRTVPYLGDQRMLDLTGAGPAVPGPGLPVSRHLRP